MGPLKEETDLTKEEAVDQISRKPNMVYSSPWIIVTLP